MSTSRALFKRTSNLLTITTRALLALFSASLALLVSMGIFMLGTRLLYADKALPGIHAAGVSLGGLTRDEIESVLGQTLTYPQTGLLVLNDSDQLWTTRPEELGVIIDLPAMALQATAIGRQGNLIERLQQQIDAWYLGHPISPIVIFDQVVGGSYLQGLARGIDRPTLEALLALNGTEVETRSGQIGRQLEIQVTLDTLAAPISRLHDADIALVINETPPQVLDASEQAEIAREILRLPLTLTVEDTDPWVIDPPELAGMLRFDLVEDAGDIHYRVTLDPQTLTAILEPLVLELERNEENARFYFDDDTGELVLIDAAVIGRSLDIPTTIETINTGLTGGQHQIPLEFEITEPVVTDDATAEALGISEPVSVVSTYFSGSSPGRIHNIKTASSAFHGLLVAPGETLSMADVLGDVSLDQGYAEALIIYGNRTIKGVGGGVCQVSTTLFRAIFFGGFPIVERHSHAYRVSYYEAGPNSPGPGLDAAVFVPLVDLKFTNDSPHWLLLETYTYGNNNQLQWKFYSTSDGRQVEWSREILSETEAPEPLYRENPDLSKGEIEKVDYQADGMNVIVYRTVTRDGEVFNQDTIKTHYLPWRAIYEYGPGTKLPRGAKTE